MKVREMLDLVEQTIEASGVNVRKPDRFIMMQWLADELSRIISMGDWDWSLVHSTVAHVKATERSVQLPENFGDNFLRWSGAQGDRYAVKLVDSSSNEQDIDYEAPLIFFDRNISSTTTGPPQVYTVTTEPLSGRRLLWIDPPANASFTLRGVWTPAIWRFEEQDQLPPINANCRVLKSALLARIFKTTATGIIFKADYDADLAALFRLNAANRRAQFIPAWQRFGYDLKD